MEFELYQAYYKLLVLCPTYVVCMSVGFTCLIAAAAADAAVPFLDSGCCLLCCMSSSDDDESSPKSSLLDAIVVARVGNEYDRSMQSKYVASCAHQSTAPKKGS